MNKSDLIKFPIKCQCGHVFTRLKDLERYILSIDSTARVNSKMVCQRCPYCLTVVHTAIQTNIDVIKVDVPETVERDTSVDLVPAPRPEDYKPADYSPAIA